MPLPLRTAAPAVAVLVLLPGVGAAQDVGETIAGLAVENAELYVKPLSEGLGHTLTAGFVTDASPHGRFGFSVGVRAAGALFPAEAETFQPVLPESVTVTFGGRSRTYQEPYVADGPSPTVAGDGAGTVLRPSGQFRLDLILAGENPDSDQWTVEFPEGLDLPLAPFAVLDASLGLGFGTDVIARLIPTIEVHEDVGDLSAFGVGVMHSVSQYLPVPTPLIDASLTFGYQRVELADYAEATSTSFGAIAGAGLGPLRVFAHGSLHGSEMDVAYTVENPDGDPLLPPDGTRLSFTNDLDRTARVALGASLDVLLLKLSAQYAFGDYEVVSVRVGFGFR